MSKPLLQSGLAHIRRWLGCALGPCLPGLHFLGEGWLAEVQRILWMDVGLGERSYHFVRLEEFVEPNSAWCAHDEGRIRRSIGREWLFHVIIANLCCIALWRRKTRPNPSSCKTTEWLRVSCSTRRTWLSRKYDREIGRSIIPCWFVTSKVTLLKSEWKWGSSSQSRYLEKMCLLR